MIVWRAQGWPGPPWLANAQSPGCIKICKCPTQGMTERKNGQHSARKIIKDETGIDWCIDKWNRKQSWKQKKKKNTPNKVGIWIWESRQLLQAKITLPCNIVFNLLHDLCFNFNIKLPKTRTAAFHYVPWVPKYVVLFLSQSFGSLYPSIYLLSTTLLMLNSIINPILYIWRDPRLRAALKSIVNTWEHLQANTNKQGSRNQLWNCTHFRRPGDKQLRLSLEDVQSNLRLSPLN